MHVYQPPVYVPRHLRKKGRASDDQAKKRAFARAARWSKRFIFLKAKALANPRIASQYLDWTEAAKRNGLRKSTGGAK